MKSSEKRNIHEGPTFTFSLNEGPENKSVLNCRRDRALIASCRLQDQQFFTKLKLYLCLQIDVRVFAFSFKERGSDIPTRIKRMCINTTIASTSIWTAET